MYFGEINLELKTVVDIRSEEPHNKDAKAEQDEPGIGGLLKDGSLVWRAHKTKLEIFSSSSGEKLLSHNFEYDSKTKDGTIFSVQQIEPEILPACVIAVGIQLDDNVGMIVVISVQGSRILGRIDLNEGISCLQPIRRKTYSKGRVSFYDGCLVVGTLSGKVLLIDACFKYEEDTIFGRRLMMNNLERNYCHIEFSSVDASQCSTNHALFRQREVYYGLQLEELDEIYSPVVSLLDLPALMALAVGFADGRMVLYNLLNLHILHISNPLIENTPIISMNYLEPTDDPKACIYIWTFHACVDSAFAVMHTLTFEEKYAESTGHTYERFIACSPRVNISCYDKGSFPLGIQSITKIVSQDEEVLTLCVLTWVASDKSTNILVFDLNQWYKAEMPFTCDWRHNLNHMVVFNIKESGMCAHLVVDSLIPFNSIHRPEEHFYPNTLCFDLINLTETKCARFHWVGLQNKILEDFEKGGSAGLVEPYKLYNIMLRAVLTPQFFDCNFTSDAPIDLQRDFLLSVALEYNCYSLLRECAINWADGSHLGQQPEEGVSLSTLTDWMWNRAKALKEISNTMCIPLFDLSGRRIDCGTQKMLLHCSRQLKQLSLLYDVIFEQCKQYIPDKIYKSLKSQASAVTLASEYQEVVQWLLNVGLLPEGNIDNINLSDEFLLVPFPYPAIQSYYATQRTVLAENQFSKEHSRCVEERSCKYLFIDNFIERYFPNETLRDTWIDNNSPGVYPANSMQNVLRCLLVPNVTTELKHILLCYTFMDITAILGDGRYGEIVQNLIKFPSVFKLSSSAIKRTQAFWFLDHGNIEAAIEELLCPISQGEKLEAWQREFLISTLLRHEAPHLALRVLRAPGMPIPPLLELQTLLENNLISEAFKLQRSKHDPSLLKSFFEGTLKSDKHEVLLDLALSDKEIQILREYLSATSEGMAENLHFIHLLHKLDFVEAVHMIDKLGRKRIRDYNLEAPKEALTLFHAALEPTTQHLCYLAYAEEKDLKPRKADYTEPLSSRLIRARPEFRNRIYHKSIVAIKEAAEPLEHAQPFLEKPGLGIFQFRTQIKSNDVCYPIRLDSKAPKRKLDEDGLSTSKHKSTANIFMDYERPRKRRRVEGDNRCLSSLVAPKSVLTEFRPMKPCFNFTARKSESTSEKSFSRSPSSNLTTPIITKMNTYNPPSPESVSSYTRHGILKSTTSAHSFVLRRSVSPVAVSVTGPRPIDTEEKVLRFDLPESPLVEKPEPSLLSTTKSSLHNPVVNDSLASNDEFFSPENSVVTLDVESCIDIKGILSSGPKCRRSIHSRSRSVTPVENNIAIIIEDVDDDSSGKQPDTNEEELGEAISGEYPLNTEFSSSQPIIADCEESAVEHPEEKTVEASVGMMTNTSSVASRLNENLQRHDSIVLQNKESKGSCTKEAISQTGVDHESDADTDCNDDLFVLDEDTDVEKAESATTSIQVESEYDEVEIGHIYFDEQETDTDGNEVLSDDTIIDDVNFVGDDEIIEDNVIIEDDSEITDEDSIIIDEEIIHISSESEDGDETVNCDESVDGQSDPEDNTSDNITPSGSSQKENTQYADFFSETVPAVIIDEEVAEASYNQNIDDVYVSTTTSSTLNPDTISERPPHEIPRREASPQEGIETNAEGSKDHQAQDLTMQQDAIPAAEPREGTPEPSSSKPRDFTIGPCERQESLSAAEVKLVSPTREENFALNKDEKFLGPPKNAHEVYVPAMNLSVKPDEAHEANRKNSKSDESDDSAALNLSTGQMFEQIALDEEPLRLEFVEPDRNSNCEEEINRGVEENRTESVQEVPTYPSEGAKESDDTEINTLSTEQCQKISESANLSNVSSAEAATNSISFSIGRDKTSTVSRRTSTENADVIITDRPRNNKARRSSERDKLGEAEHISSKTITLDESVPSSRRRTRASSVTLETSCLTPRRMPTRASSAGRDIALFTPIGNISHGDGDKESSNDANIVEDAGTPVSIKRATRASSAAPEDTLQKSSTKQTRKYSSMQNLSTPEYLTPRRSTRVAAIVKESTSTPSKTRKTSERESGNTPSTISKKSENTADIINPTNTAVEETRSSPGDDEKSQKSNVSSSSRRSARRKLLLSKTPAEPTISEELFDPTSASEKQSGSSFAEYTTNRRLTRHQSALIERSLGTVQKTTINQEPPVQEVQSDQDSDVDSIDSNISHNTKQSVRSKSSQNSKKAPKSSRGKRKPRSRSTRSSVSKQDNSDEESTDTDTGESPRKRQTLETISEEADEPKRNTRQRGRKNKP